MIDSATATPHDADLKKAEQGGYLTVSRPDEMRKITRQAITDQGMEMPVGKRKKGQAQKFKLIEWSPELFAVIDEALRLQRTSSLCVSGNSDGQPYTTSGWNTNLRRLMERARKMAENEGIAVVRFTLEDMRPTAVTDRVEHRDDQITKATGHSSDGMVRQVYDRRKLRRPGRPNKKAPWPLPLSWKPRNPVRLGWVADPPRSP